MTLKTIADEIDNGSLLPTPGDGKSAPLIGITGNFDEGKLALLPGYFRSLEAVGCIPVVIPPRKRFGADLAQLVDRLDGLLLSGGADINPVLLDEDPVPALHGINDVRDEMELALARLAYNSGVPMLGICRGIQLLAAAFGGSVHQDLATALPQAKLLKHSQEAERHVPTHFVETAEGSIVRELFGKRLAVNSFHHQAVNAPGPLFRVTAQSADGVVEAIESTDAAHFAVGVQWHPECFLAGGDESMLPLFRRFRDEAAAHADAKQIHARVRTLDSHCDTPMFFEKGVDLERRDPQLLVDFPKMREGRLDATIMVAYIPQGERTPEASEQATRKAFSLLRDIESRVKAAPGVELAKSPQDVSLNKRNGKLSILRGIENGYAIGKDLDNIRRFRDECGIVYITLCHNGDNDLCDSARRSNGEHGGLSAFGRQAIAEMNRRGVMVDLSHASEQSFYQAIEASETPIVCSHSSSCALCNHPRNLTDDQLRALAQCGGVAQVTLYHGFLRDDEEQGRPASVEDAVRHLVHMVEVAGVDHVGIGTDFDGDGGVPGCANASELLHFTKLLRREGFTVNDLEMIWGGNFLRVMQQCQNHALSDNPTYFNTDHTFNQ